MNMFKVLIEGFKTKNDAALFLDWFSNQGEQDCYYDYELRGDYSYSTDDRNTFAQNGEVEFDGSGCAKLILEPSPFEDEKQT